jgi:outer membrane lipoprotein-sorting protein
MRNPETESASRIVSHPVDTKAIVWLDQEKALPRRLEIHEESGATRTLSLSRIRVNEPLPSQTFAFKAPKGVRVVEQ